MTLKKEQIKAKRIFRKMQMETQNTKTYKMQQKNFQEGNSWL